MSVSGGTTDGGVRVDLRAEKETFHALDSDVRRRILESLATGAQGIPELSRALGVPSATLRYHLGVLLQDGLVGRIPTHPEGRVGRPVTRFRLLAPPNIGPPPRQFETLADLLLRVVASSLPREEWERALFEAGRDSGAQMIAALREEARVPAWTPERFAHVCVEGVFARMGMRTEVLEVRADGVRYRAHACPFQELAVRYPDRICDHLDEGFHQGVASALGGVATTRLACLGHGDPYCEYSLRWSKRSREAVG